MNRSMFGAVASLVFVVGSLSTPAFGQRSPQMFDIIGDPADRATNTIRSRGFEFVDSRNDRFSNRHTYWWNARSQSCLHVVSFQSRIIRVADGSLTECRQSNNRGTQAVSLLGIIGDRSDPATRVLRSRGFEFADSHDDRYNNRHTYWWNDRGNNCVHVVSFNRTITRVVDAADSECGKGASSSSATDGYDALVGMRASTGMDDMSSRGFVQVDNFTSGNTRYSIQYRLRTRQCVQVTIADGRFTDVRDIGTHPKCNPRGVAAAGNGGSSSTAAPVSFSDLRNARASGGMSTLERRGFRQVDNFTSGTTRYSIQWRAASRQCVQVTIADGRFVDLRDIGQHPNCR